MFLLGMFLCLPLAIGYMIGRNMQYITVPENPEYMNGIAGLNFEGSEPGNYSYVIPVKNPNENLTVRVWTYVFSDPEDLKNFVSYSCSLKNGTRLGPLESKDATFSFTVADNPYEFGEIYFRVGSLRVGVDY